MLHGPPKKRSPKKIKKIKKINIKNVIYINSFRNSLRCTLSCWSRLGKNFHLLQEECFYCAICSTWCILWKSAETKICNLLAPKKKRQKKTKSLVCADWFLFLQLLFLQASSKVIFDDACHILEVVLGHFGRRWKTLQDSLIWSSCLSCWTLTPSLGPLDKVFWDSNCRWGARMPDQGWAWKIYMFAQIDI